MHSAPCDVSPVARRRWTITGQVQGVGFRPFVYRLAVRSGLRGFVCNTASGVTVECQGRAEDLDRFRADLQTQAPGLARLDSVLCDESVPLADEPGFSIARSAAGLAEAQVTPDAATCPDCAAEITSRADRRVGYGLTNCTNCGPRYTIIRRVPYDRQHTTMAGFAMCRPCRGEYDSPLDRRFHAEPIACPRCGPQVGLVDPLGRPIAGDDPIAVAASRLAAGQIVAIKGLGGFHLAMRGDDERAVGRLRELKRRSAKPFALMCRSVEAAEQLVTLSTSAVALMRSPVCPIVLAPRRAGSAVADAVAPGSHRLGVMLPYTPIHHLLFAADPRLPALVMTSGNVSDEPLVIDNDECLARLGGMCDAILWHDRPIERAVDDSVFIDLGDQHDPLPVRRARGLVPVPVTLPTPAADDGVCAGADLKGAAAVVRDGQAFLGHHLGDLEHPLALASLHQNIDDLIELFGVRPRWVAHDLHPGYFSTRYAKRMAARFGVPAIAVQHHHAHAAALMAEHGITEPVLAVVCDGAGYGDDGTTWGGELLLADLLSYRRVAHLRPIRLPGGDAAAREPRRAALALLWNAAGTSLGTLPIARRLVEEHLERTILCRMIGEQLNSPPSTSTGRVFDAMAAILGLCQRNTFEAQAAMALESAAQRHGPLAAPPPLLAELRRDPLPQIDLSGLAMHVADQAAQGADAGMLAALFHEQLAMAWDIVIADAAATTGVRTVGLTGGVFCNQLLMRRLSEMLEARGLRVLRHRVVPPNDGGIALGQAAIASARLAAHGNGS